MQPTTGDPARDADPGYATACARRLGFAAATLHVQRRFRDFLWLHERLLESYPGVLVPPVPEKSLVGKFAAQDSAFVERRRAALEHFVCRVARHPLLRTTVELRYFLEYDEIRESVTTVGLSSQPLMRMLHSLSEALASVTVKVNASEDEFFEDRSKRVQVLEEYLKATLRELSAVAECTEGLASATGAVANSIMALSQTVRGHSQLADALSRFSSAQASSSIRLHDRASRDWTQLIDLIRDFLLLIRTVQDNLMHRRRLYSRWLTARQRLLKLRDEYARLKPAMAPGAATAANEKALLARADLQEARQELKELKRFFKQLSRTLRDELDYFFAEKTREFHVALLRHVDAIVSAQREVVEQWRATGAV